MLPIVDWAIRCCPSFAVRVSVESGFTRVSAEYDRYCSTCIQLIFHEVCENFSHRNADKLYDFCMVFV
ncbi:MULTISPECIES: hypothetical protein [unclassified Nostoc]|uniref:hypothetical protein n=1 Tax=unclassified Nostoc TaxID=2593658 RepID=UPI0013D7DC57|nr:MULTISPECIES: hypothetical protein [unclassified Nostoc]MBE8997589.1 hypothetical protein [Nostoc sp. LEGE 12447]NEU79831.1 hypothetical protein [Nostoc sp. UIC 10630]